MFLVVGCAALVSGGNVLLVSGCRVFFLEDRLYSSLYAGLVLLVLLVLFLVVVGLRWDCRWGKSVACQ